MTSEEATDKTPLIPDPSPTAQGPEGSTPSDEDALKKLSVSRYAATAEDPLVYEAMTSTWLNSIMWFWGDIGDSWWVTGYQTIGFAAFGLLLGVTTGWEYAQAITVVTGCSSVASAIIAILSPIIGAISDTLGNRKVFVILFATINFASVAVMPFVQNLWLVAVCFTASQIFVQQARLCYDAQVPFVIEPKKRPLVQAIGGAVGVFGSIGAIVWSIIAKVIWGSWSVISGPPKTHSDSSSSGDVISMGGMKPYLIGTAIMYAVTMSPYVFHTEKQRRRNDSIANGLVQTLRDMKQTTKEILGDRNGICLTIVWLIIIDAFFSWQAVAAIAIPATVGLNSKQFDYLIVVVLPICFIFALIGGWVIGRWGCKVGSVVTSLGFLSCEVGMIFSNLTINKFHIPKELGYLGFVFKHTRNPSTSFADNSKIESRLFLNGVGVGFLTITPRFFIIQLAPPTRVAQWMGFQRVAGKITSILSPILYSVIINFALKKGSSYDHAWRYVFLYRLSLQVIAFFVLTIGIVDPHRRYMSGERAPYRNLYEPGGTLPRDDLILRSESSDLVKPLVADGSPSVPTEEHPKSV